MKKSESRKMVGSMISTGVANLVGVGLISPTATMINALDAGTAKTIASTIPGLQSTALLGANIKLAKDSLGEKTTKKSSKKGKNYW